jgi:HD-like signal output (HDOD) protein
MNMIQDANVDKVGEALKAQRFQMLEDIARELSSGSVVFPTCFDAALRLRKELQNPDLPIPRMVKVVALEPLVATRLMQMAGSVLYSPDGTPARDLQAAIHRLGVELVRTSALAIAMSQLLRAKETAVFGDFAKALWGHSIRTAAATRLLAQTYTRINPDQALLAGLVHDLGAFYMLYRAAQYEELRVRPGTVKHVMLQWHEGIGVSLLSALGLPEDIVNAVTDHDQPRSLPDPLRTLGDLVYVGNLLAGSHLEWFGQDAGIEAAGGQVDAVRSLYAELLPQIEADSLEMQAVLS